MIFHINRVTMKADATAEQIEAALDSWRNQGRTIPAVKSFIVGRDHGGDYQYSAVFVVEDLDGLFAYLTHETTYQTDHLGLDLVERLDIFDVSDDGYDSLVLLDNFQWSLNASTVVTHM